MYGNWPEGPVCEYCARKAKRMLGVCASAAMWGACPASIRPVNRHVEPAAASSSHWTRPTGLVPLDCQRCGAEGELYRAATCLRRALADDGLCLSAAYQTQPYGVFDPPVNFFS